MKSLCAATMTILVMAAAVSPAFAQDTNPQSFTSQEQTLCQPDVFRLCNEFVPDDVQIAACMKAKRKQLSPECRKVFDAHMKTRAK